MLNNVEQGNIEMKKAKPRRERQYPQVERILSTNFPAGFEKIKGKCFVPKEDFQKLQKKYSWMFNRYKKAKSQ